MVDSDTRETGMVSKYLENRGFGFLEDGMFFHISDFRSDDVYSVAPGQRVSYRVRRTPKGLAAFDIVLI